MAEESNSTLDVLQTYEETTSGKRPSPHSSQENNPMTIDETIALVMSTDGNSSRQLKSTAHRLMKLSETNLRSYTSNGLDPLTVLDPQAHSLAYLFFLTSRCLAVQEPPQARFFLESISHFIGMCDPRQLLFAPKRIRFIARALEHLATILGNPLIPIRPLRTAIDRIMTDKRSLLSLHAAYIKACLLAKLYRQPLEILDHDIENVDPAAHGINIEDFLLYHYYGALIYIGNKNYERAIYFLSLVISAPSQAISAIQLTAYKKFILISLIHYGKPCSLPSYTSNAIEKAFKAKHSQYLDIQNAFGEDLFELKRVIEKHAETLTTDSNMGLAKQCVTARRQLMIKQLSDVYCALSLKEMATMLDPERQDNIAEHDVESMLVDMIAADKLHARISYSVNESNQSIKMVSFPEEKSTDSKEIVQFLQDRIRDAANLGQKVSAMDRQESLSKEFQSKYMALHAQGGPVSTTSFDEDMELPLDDDSKIYA